MKNRYQIGKLEEEEIYKNMCKQGLT